MPTVFIGLPVFNGGAYLEETIRSILNQTYSDFILFISDNASTDNTENICRGFVKKDPRVTYVRQKENLGWRKNFQYVRQAADTDYFMWIAADDPLAPTFLSCVIRVYERHPNIVGVMSDIIEIDSFGTMGSTILLDNIRVDESLKNWDRTKELFFQNPTTNIFFCIYAVFRTHEIKKIKLNYKGLVKYASSSEIPVLAQVALKGPIVSISQPLKFYRKHEDSMYVSEKVYSNMLERYKMLLNVSYILLLITRDANINKISKIRLYRQTIKKTSYELIKFLPRYIKLKLKI